MSMSSDLRLIETLTDREMEVLRLIAEGKTNPEIGEALGIRFPTAKWYVSEVLQKLQVPTREAAAAEYRRYNRAPARLRRALAAVPIVGGWVVAAGAGAAAVIAIVMIITLGDDGAAEERWLIAYVNADRLIESPQPEPIHIVDAKTGEEWDLGEPALWGAVRWSPRGDRLLAMSRESQLLLLSYPSGDPIDYMAPDLAAYSAPAESGNPNAEAYASLLDIHWAPDGERFFAGGILYDADGNIVASYEGALAASWSPDSERFATVLDGAIYVIDRDGSLVFQHEDIPVDVQTGRPVSTTLWLSPSELAVPVPGRASDGGLQLSIVDLAEIEPSLGPVQPAVRLLEQQNLEAMPEYDAAVASIEPLLAAVGQHPGAIRSGESPGIHLSVTGELGDQTATAQKLRWVAVTDGEEAALVELSVRWVLASEIDVWGPRLSFVILD
jgi:DNA-binding CsgD family transcriptional regulator